MEKFCQYYLAVDIGASSGRHVLGHLEDGRLVTEEIYRFANGLIPKTGKDGNTELCWDVEELFAQIKEGMKRCKAEGLIPVSMGVDTWGVDFVLLDKEQRQIGNVVGYRDMRTQGMDEVIEQKLSGEALYAKTGIQKQIFNTIYQLTALLQITPETLAQTERMLLMPDYFHYLLTGQLATEYTNATTTQLIDPKTQNWDWQLIEQLGFPKKIFCPVKTPGTLLGVLTKEVADEVGFSCSVVLPATHDTGSAVAAVPCPSEEVLYISSGTWSLMGTERKAADCSEKSRRHNFTNEGGVDYRYRYLKNIMGLWMIQSVQKALTDPYSFAELCKKAEEAKIDSLVECDDDRFLSPESMIKTLQDACKEQGKQIPQTPGELARVIYRSLAACYTKTLQELEEMTGVSYPAIYIVGGGSNADYLNRLTAHAAKRRVYAGPSEATAIGNLTVQMLKNKAWKTLQEARSCIAESCEIRIFEA